MTKRSIKTIIPGLRDTGPDRRELGGHHQSTFEKRSDVVGALRGGGERKKPDLLPLKGKPGGGAENPPGRCPGCNCKIPGGRHGRRCRYNYK